jgi:RNA polymerase sigma-70 factor (ECF subfamily)
MMTAPQPDSEELLREAAAGNAQARERLLMRHQRRLLQFIRLRMDRRLAARVDAADVLQETLLEAVRQLPDYLRRRPLPFYPWLRQLALDGLAELHRCHVQTQKRSVSREERQVPPLSGQSALELAGQLLARGSSPSARLRHKELRARVQDALAQLAERDREVLVLRHLEHLAVAEIAAILGISEGAVYTRHLRALQRLRGLLGDEFLEGGS